MLFKGSKDYEGIKKACMEHAENIKMLDSSTTSIFQKTKKSDRDLMEDKMGELCKQVGNLYLIMMKQPRQAQKQAEPLCHKCCKKGHYSSQCRMEHESTCYKCGRAGHRASECRSKVDMPSTLTFCHWVGHTAENCFIKRSNEAVETQHVRFAKNSEPTETQGAGPSGQNNIIFVKEDDPVEEENTVAAFKRSADGETLT